MYAEAYAEPWQAFKMNLFAKIVNGWKPLTFFAKSSNLDVWQGSEYASCIDELESTDQINTC